MAKLAMVAAASWLLMLPPFNKPSSSVPFSQWEQLGSYGTAQECEADRQEHQNHYYDLYRKLNEKSEWSKSDWNTSLELIRQQVVRCIPADEVFGPAKTAALPRQ